MEKLDEHGLFTHFENGSDDGIHTIENQVQERCRVLADADLVPFLTERQQMVGLTTKGQRYLKGEVDAELYPRPRNPSSWE